MSEKKETKQCACGLYNECCCGQNDCLCVRQHRCSIYGTVLCRIKKIPFRPSDIKERKE